jgi:hypothetical protein
MPRADSLFEGRVVKLSLIVELFSERLGLFHRRA